ncbi:MAG: hypothetical protein NTY87_01935 [Planctomycetia bacterium]|nr:hypothetical protein [Planctomycetia bacterium]
MNILLTNDDGIDAPGLVALSQAIECLGATAVVVAPLLPHSGCVSGAQSLLRRRHAG